MNRKVFCKLIESKGRNVWNLLPKQFDNSGNVLTELSIALSQTQIDRTHYNVGCVLGINPDDLKPDKHSRYYTYTGEIMKILTSPFNDVEYVNYEKYKDLSWDELTKIYDKIQNSLLNLINNDSGINMPTIEKDGFYVKESDFKIIVRNIKRNVNTMILGPTGSGKSSIVQLIAEQLGLPFTFYDMGAMHDPISDLLGVHRLENGNSVFDYARFVEDVQKPGVICLDEISRCSPVCWNILFPVLDHRRTLPVEIAGCKDVREVKIHPDCVFFATANVGLEYTSTSTLDKALTNRFFPIEFCYLPEEIEFKVLMKRHNIDSISATLISNVATKIRRLYNDQDLTTAISTRETLMIASLVSDGWDLVDSMKTILLPLYEKEERDKVIKLLMSK